MVIIIDYVIILLPKDGNIMKRLSHILTMLILIFALSACTDQTEIKDLVPPSIIVTKEFTYTIGDPVPNFLEGVQAIDSIDGDLTDSITIDDSEVDYETSGIYNLKYIVSDLSGNRITKTVQVIVIESNREIDTIPPVILGASHITFYIGDPEPDFLVNLSAYDNVEGNITSRISVESSRVKYDTEGDYPVTYTVTDSSGNTISITINITVLNPDSLDNITSLNIFYINDTHGAILNNSNQLGLARIGNLILDEKDLNPNNTLFITGGDILQGSVLSNYFKGSSMIDILNQMSLDAFVLGNHEFDWGLGTVTEYFNPDTTGIKAEFPLLAANVFLKNTTTRPEHIDAYTIVEKGNLKVGIIGLMGYGLENSIATSMVKDYYFDDPVIWAGHYAQQLRLNHEVDVVLVVVHGSSGTMNSGIGNLTGNQRVDAVFNGHTHQNYVNNFLRSGVTMPIIQSGANGTTVGRVSIELNLAGEVIGASAKNLYPATVYGADQEYESRLLISNSAIADLILTYVEEISPLLNEVIIQSGTNYSRDQLTYYMAELIRVSASADIGFHNFGGTRDSLSSLENITVATLYDIFPFDNKVKTVSLLGSDIKDFIDQTSGDVAASYKAGFSYQMISDNDYYLVSTNEYIFDKVDNPFIFGIDPIDTGVIIRDVLEDVLRNQAEVHDYFYIENPIVLSNRYHTNLFIGEEKRVYSVI
jgi:2',3'-cyclic-nucleotide 2'-phosphodiesterase (5'-nucleotidase family)